MPNAEPARRARHEPGSDVLGLLADALLGRVESLISERVEGLAASASVEAADDRWLKVSEVAERVGACERTVYRALRSGALAGERLGTHWRVRPGAVEAWLSGSPKPSAAERPPRPLAAPPGSAPPGGRAFTARASALRGTRSAAGQATIKGRPGAGHEEPS